MSTLDARGWKSRPIVYHVMSVIWYLPGLFLVISLRDSLILPTEGYLPRERFIWSQEF